MADSEDPVVRKAHQGINRWVPMLVILASISALGFGIYQQFAPGGAQHKASEANRKAERAMPCVDTSKQRGLQPSGGCGQFFALLVNYCALHPVACARSQRQAVKAAQTKSADDAIGPLARLRGGGGGTPGSTPRSPKTPSPTPGGGGGGGGGSGGGEQPSQPNQPAPKNPSNPPSSGGGNGGQGGGGGEQQPAPSQPNVQVPPVLQPLLPNVCTPLLDVNCPNQ